MYVYISYLTIYIDRSVNRCLHANKRIFIVTHTHRAELPLHPKDSTAHIEEERQDKTTKSKGIKIERRKSQEQRRKIEERGSRCR